MSQTHSIRDQPATNIEKNIIIIMITHPDSYRCGSASDLPPMYYVYLHTIIPMAMTQALPVGRPNPLYALR